MREDMIGAEVIEKATDKRLGRLVAWSTWGSEDGVEPCAVVCADNGEVFGYGLPGLRLVMAAPVEDPELAKLQEQIATLRKTNSKMFSEIRERRDIDSERRALDKEQEAFFYEKTDAGRLVNKLEDETLPQAILRALAEARKEARRGQDR